MSRNTDTDRDTTKQDSLLQQADSSQPALNYSVSLQRAAASVGFDWPDSAGVIAKIKEELDEVVAEINSADPERLRDEIGDLLFAVTNLARHVNVDPEHALRNSIDKFYRRFNYIERQFHPLNKTPDQCDLSALDELWDEAKLAERDITPPQKSRP